MDSATGPAACPAHLQHVDEDGLASPIELVAGAFDLFKGVASEYVIYIYSSLYISIRFIVSRSFVDRSTML